MHHTLTEPFYSYSQGIALKSRASQPKRKQKRNPNTNLLGRPLPNCTTNTLIGIPYCTQNYWDPLLHSKQCIQALILCC